MAKNDLATKTGSTAIVLASNFEEDAQSGFNNMTQEDFALPFLKLLTSTSPEIGEMEGAMPGMVLNSVTNELYDGKKGCWLFQQHIFASILNGLQGAQVVGHPLLFTRQLVIF